MILTRDKELQRKLHLAIVLWNHRFLLRPTAPPGKEQAPSLGSEPQVPPVTESPPQVPPATDRPASRDEAPPAASKGGGDGIA